VLSVSAVAKALEVQLAVRVDHFLTSTLCISGPATSMHTERKSSDYSQLPITNI